MSPTGSYFPLTVITDKLSLIAQTEKSRASTFWAKRFSKTRKNSAINSETMAFKPTLACPFCHRTGFKSNGGLTQHINRTPSCRLMQEASFGLPNILNQTKQPKIADFVQQVQPLLHRLQAKHPPVYQENEANQGQFYHEGGFLIL